MTNQRKHSRFSTCQNRTFGVRLPDTPDGESRQGSVMDISRDGARLAVSWPLSVGDEIDIELHANRFQKRRRARVCWAALRRDFQWHAGVEFDEPLAEDDLNGLASGGIIERRQSKRSKVSIAATVREQSSTSDHDVRITDLSTDGLGLSSPEPLELDGRVMISISQESEPLIVLALVRSCTSKRKGYVIGCELVDADAYRHLRQFLPARRPPARRTVWRVLRDYAFDAAATFLCVAAVAQWGLTSHTIGMKSGDQDLRMAVALEGRLF